MIRIVEILVAVNAACGIAAFLLARNAWNRAKDKLGLDDENESSRNLEPPERR